MELSYKKLGNGTSCLGSRQALIILHGLYGSGDNWLTIGKKLAEYFKVYLIDQRNHGNSPHDISHNYSVMATDLHVFFVNQNISKASIIGHSMGGKTAMVFTQMFPDKINKQIIVDISPKNYVNTDESKEHYKILECLQKINFKICKNYNDIEKQLRNYLPEERLRNFLLKSIKREGKGCFSWKINIPVLIQSLPSIFAGINENLIVQNKTLFIKGALSNHILENDLTLIKKIFVNSEIKTIQNAGHWVHVEQPMEFHNMIMEFL